MERLLQTNHMLDPLVGRLLQISLTVTLLHQTNSTEDLRNNMFHNMEPLHLNSNIISPQIHIRIRRLRNHTTHIKEDSKGCIIDHIWRVLRYLLKTSDLVM